MKQKRQQRRIRILGEEFILYRVKVLVLGRKDRMWAWRAKAKVPITIEGWSGHKSVEFMWRTVVSAAGDTPITRSSQAAMVRHLKMAYFGKE